MNGGLVEEIEIRTSWMDRALNLFIYQISDVKTIGCGFGLKSQEKKWLLKMSSVLVHTYLQHGNL